jgi:hypothetical protein
LWPNLGGFERAALFGLGLLVFAATAHRCQFHFITESNVAFYTRSPLLAIEMFGTLGSLLMIPLFVIRALYLFSRQQMMPAVVALLVGFAAFVAFAAVFLIDWPLVHMT